jgi:hypothetical protein
MARSRTPASPAKRKATETAAAEKRESRLRDWLVVLWAVAMTVAVLAGYVAINRVQKNTAELIERVRTAEMRSDARATEERTALLCSSAESLAAAHTTLLAIRDLVDPNGATTPEQEQALREIDTRLRTIEVPETDDAECHRALAGVSDNAEPG